MKNLRKQTFAGALTLSVLVTANPAFAQQTPLANTNRTPVQFSQLLQPGESIALGEAAAEVASRSYYQRVTANELTRGVDIITQAPGAVVRLTPIGARSDKAKGKLRTSDLEISRAGGNPVALERSGAIVADQAELSAGQPELFDDTLAFTTPQAMGQGRFKLRNKGKAVGDQDYMIHVFDKASDSNLKVTSARQHAFASETVSGSITLENAAIRKGARISAHLAGPNGQRIDLATNQSGDAVAFSGALPENVQFNPGELWRAVVSYRETGGEAPLFRDAELALAAGEKTAVLKGASSADEILTIRANIMKAGRYEARAWIYARHGDLAEAPAMLAQTAAWLEPGEQALSLNVDRAALAAAGFAPPYKVKQMQLIDQSRLMVLETDASHFLIVTSE